MPKSVYPGRNDDIASFLEEGDEYLDLMHMTRLAPRTLENIRLEAKRDPNAPKRRAPHQRKLSRFKYAYRGHLRPYIVDLYRFFLGALSDGELNYLNRTVMAEKPWEKGKQLFAVTAAMLMYRQPRKYNRDILVPRNKIAGFNPRHGIAQSIRAVWEGKDDFHELHTKTKAEVEMLKTRLDNALELLEQLEELKVFRLEHFGDDEEFQP